MGVPYVVIGANRPIIAAVGPQTWPTSPPLQIIARSMIAKMTSGSVITPDSSRNRAQLVLAVSLACATKRAASLPAWRSNHFSSKVHQSSLAGTGSGPC